MPKKKAPITWDRQQAEGPQAYAAFEIYRDFGPERSISKVSQKAGKSISLLRRWSAKYKWVERCRLYDNHIDETVRREAMRKYREMNRRQIKEALEMQEKALSELQKIPVDSLSPADIARFIERSVSIERTIRKDELELIQKTAGTEPEEDPITKALKEAFE